MKRPPMRRTARDWTAAWLGIAAAALLLLAAAFLSQIHSQQMQDLRAQAARTRAQLIAQSISQRLANATAAGIPLRQLVGVPEFLDRWHASHPEIAHIAVHGLDGRQLWTGHAPALAPTAELSSGSAAVIAAHVAQARVRLQVHNASRQGLGQRLVLLAPAVLLVSALAYLGAHFACAQGPWLRNHGLRMIARWVARGDYRQLLVLPQRQPFDLRVQEVAHAMRNQHERMLRMRLLIASLRRTEPQQLRRDHLDQILQQVEGQNRFADTEPGRVRLVAVQSQSLWQALLLCLGAVAPLAYALQLVAHTAGSAWQPTLAAACVGLLVLAAAAGWKLGAGLRMTTLGLLLPSQAALLLAPLALLLDSAPHPGWIAAWNGIFAGAALAACSRAQTHPETHPGFAQARPALPGAALLGWWLGLLWLAPALGYYVHAALPPHWAGLALLLPMACALGNALRWDVAHSPWRARMAPGTAPATAPATAPGNAKNASWAGCGCALGLAGGALLAELVAPAGTAAALVLLQQCALGAGLAWLWPRQGAPAACASQDASGPWLLLGSAFGAALSAGAMLLGLQGWTPALALLLAWLAAALAKGRHVA